MSLFSATAHISFPLCGSLLGTAVGTSLVRGIPIPGLMAAGAAIGSGLGGAAGEWIAQVLIDKREEIGFGAIVSTGTISALTAGGSVLSYRLSNPMTLQGLRRIALQFTTAKKAFAYRALANISQGSLGRGIDAWVDGENPIVTINPLAIGIDFFLGETLFRVILGRSIRYHLDSGEGYFILKNFALSRWDWLNNIQLLALTASIARPKFHGPGLNKLVWDIKPQNVDRPFGTFSENARKAPLHSDGIYKKRPPKYLALTCLQPSKNGGSSYLVHGPEMMKVFASTAKGPAIIAQLKKPFKIRVPSAYSHKPSQAEFIEAPVFREKPFCLRFREDTLLDALNPQASQNISKEAAIRGLTEFLDTYPKIEFTMERGDILFMNNRTMLHGRDEFYGPRYLKRVWMV